MHQHISPAIFGGGVPLSPQAPIVRQPDFAVIRRSELLASNLWHKKRAPLRFEAAGLSLSVWPGELDDLADTGPVRYISLSAGNSAVSVSVPVSLIEKILESYGLPSGYMPRDPVILLLLEHRFAKAIDALEQHLKSPLAVSDIGLDAPVEGTDAVCLNAQCRLFDGEYSIALSLPAALAFRLVNLLDVSASVQHSGVTAPIEMACRIGVTQLTLKVLESVRIGDVILADSAAGKGTSVIAIGEQFFAKARWEGSTVTLLERPIKSSQEYGKVWSMSNAANSGGAPDAIDAEFNDIQVKVVFELGRQEIRLGDLRSLIPGYVFDLSRDQRTAVDIYAGTQRIGLGEVVQVNDTLGVRITRLFNNE